jgi:hypothetical protein
MRNNNHLAGLVSALAVTAFVTLARNGLAIPISLNDDLDAWGRTERGGHLQKDQSEPLWSDHGRGKIYFADPVMTKIKPTVPAIFIASRLAAPASSFRRFKPFKHPNHNHSGSPAILPSGSGLPSASVPDGGKTVMMLGGVFCIFVLLGEKNRMLDTKNTE